MRKEASRTATLDRFVVADLCERLPFDDGTFDLVYANFVIEHLAKPAATFVEWRRVLRPAGSLVIVTSNRDSPLLKVGALLPDRARVALKWRGAGAVERDVFPTFYGANTPEAALVTAPGRGVRPGRGLLRGHAAQVRSEATPT